MENVNRVKRKRKSIPRGSAIIATGNLEEKYLKAKEGQAERLKLIESLK